MSVLSDLQAQVAALAAESAATRAAVEAFIASHPGGVASEADLQALSAALQPVHTDLAALATAVAPPVPTP